MHREINWLLEPDNDQLDWAWTVTYWLETQKSNLSPIIYAPYMWKLFLRKEAIYKTNKLLKIWSEDAEELNTT